MKVDWPYSEIGRKMANGQLLFCTLFLVLLIMFNTFFSYASAYFQGLIFCA